MVATLDIDSCFSKCIFCNQSRNAGPHSCWGFLEPLKKPPNIFDRLVKSSNMYCKSSSCGAARPFPSAITLPICSLNFAFRERCATNEGVSMYLCMGCASQAPRCFGKSESGVASYEMACRTQFEPLTLRNQTQIYEERVQESRAWLEGRRLSLLPHAALRCSLPYQTQRSYPQRQGLKTTSS